MVTMNRSPFPSAPRSDSAARNERFTIPTTVEQLLLVTSVFWVLTANRAFFAAAVESRSLSEVQAWGFSVALGALLVAVHFFLLALIVKPLDGQAGADPAHRRHGHRFALIHAGLRCLP